MQHNKRSLGLPLTGKPGGDNCLNFIPRLRSAVVCREPPAIRGHNLLLKVAVDVHQLGFHTEEDGIQNHPSERKSDGLLVGAGEEALIYTAAALHRGLHAPRGRSQSCGTDAARVLEACHLHAHAIEEAELIPQLA